MAHALDFELPEQLTVGVVQALHEQLETLVDDKKMITSYCMQAVSIALIQPAFNCYMHWCWPLASGKLH